MLKTISILFGAFAVIFFFLAFLFNPNSMTPAVEYTLKGNRKIEAALHDGVGFVEDFRVKSDTLPTKNEFCLLYTSPSPRDLSTSRMPSSA